MRSVTKEDEIRLARWREFEPAASCEYLVDGICTDKYGLEIKIRRDLPEFEKLLHCSNLRVGCQEKVCPKC